MAESPWTAPTPEAIESYVWQVLKKNGLAKPADIGSKEHRLRSVLAEYIRQRLRSQPMPTSRELANELNSILTTFE